MFFATLTTRFIQYALLAALILATPPPLAAQDIPTRTGLDLLESLELTLKIAVLPSESELDLFVSYYEHGFVRGMAEGLAMGGHLCLPENMLQWQPSRIVRKFLDDHPERLHEAERLLASTALLRAYPSIHQSVSHQHAHLHLVEALDDLSAEEIDAELAKLEE